MKRILGPLVLAGVLTAATVGRAQWWPFGSGDRDEIADLRVEVAELQMTERRLLEENAALTATNQTLQSELNRVRDSEVEVERLRGDLARALSDLVGSRARTEEVRNQLSRLRNSWGWRLGAVLNSPGKHPFALDRRLDAGSGGPAARREVEVGLFRRVADRASEHRWVTDAGRAPRGVAGGALVMSPGVRAGRR